MLDLAAGRSDIRRIGRLPDRSAEWKTMTRNLSALVVSMFLSACLAAEREKDSGQRKRPEMPEIKKPVLFNTAEADKILESLQVFPADNPWNEDISKLPVRANSKKI